MQQDQPELGDVNNDEQVTLIFGRVFRPSTVARHVGFDASSALYSRGSRSEPSQDFRRSESLH
jgi:hypothetical protein